LIRVSGLPLAQPRIELTQVPLRLDHAFRDPRQDEVEQHGSDSVTDLTVRLQFGSGPPAIHVSFTKAYA